MPTLREHVKRFRAFRATHTTPRGSKTPHTTRQAGKNRPPGMWMPAHTERPGTGNKPPVKNVPRKPHRSNQPK